MITNPATLKLYFAELAAEFGCSFVYGNSDRILNRQLSSLKYPVLWLETPEMRLRRNGTLVRDFHTAFLCLTDAPGGAEDVQDDALDEMHLLTEQVLQRMQADSETHPTPFLFDMEGAISEQKYKWSGDDDWGWRTEFELTGAACETEDCCE